MDWSTPAQALLAVNTDRGFTGHEHLDEIGLIHMTKSLGAILNRRRRAAPGRGQGSPE
ncbi:hypothetical protein [Immundisolibacter sp.]|uniref:hypothetical protein n=1 Tax=Immundisolibacter sp. TaxID=1934948 RepID=UPI00356829C0